MDMTQKLWDMTQKLLNSEGLRKRHRDREVAPTERLIGKGEVFCLGISAYFPKKYRQHIKVDKSGFGNPSYKKSKHYSYERTERRDVSKNSFRK